MASLPCLRVGILRQPISPVVLDSVLGSSMHWRCCWLVPLHGIRSCNLEWARCDLVTSVDPLGGGDKKDKNVAGKFESIVLDFKPMKKRKK